MRAIKFVIVDILKSKYQIAFMFAFSFFAFGLGIWVNGSDSSALMGMLYMCFGAIILSTQPFMQDQIAESGMLNMLPLSRKERVTGRFLYGAAYIVYGALIGICSMLIVNIRTGMPAHWLESLAIFLGIGWLMIGLQYTLFYAIGKFKSQQFASIIMMLPGFVMFFGGMSVVERLPQVLSFWLSHFQLLAVVMLAVGIVIWFVGIQISAFFVNNRDMN